MHKFSSRSRMRKQYFLRFIFRVSAAVAVVLLWVFLPDCFSVIEDMNFFHNFSPLHILWVIWVADMFLQLIPARRYIAMGSQKQFARYHQPAQNPTKDALQGFIKSSNRSACLVMIIWVAFILCIGALYWLDLFEAPVLLLITVFFFVCDLICVLFWCPFRVFLMRNRCCTTCRIFNWDHLMMFSPLVFIPGFFTWSLFAASLVVFAVWEVLFHLHPERFWDRTNRSLRCISCTDHLCGRNPASHCINK